MRTSILTLVTASAIAGAAVVILPAALSNDATAQPPQRPSQRPPATAQPPQRPPATAQAPAPAPRVLLDPRDTLVLLIDHQTGLLQTVRDLPLASLRANTVVLGKIAELARVPVLTTASEPNGPNGPLMPELATAAPSARYIARKGEVSAWDNEDFRKAVRASGRKTLIIAGVWTSVCVAFPAIQARAEGYTVYAVMDASGDMSEMAAQAAMARMVRAGVIPVTTNTVMGEIQRTWARPDAARWGALYSELVPSYRAAAESYQRALSRQPPARQQASSR